MTQTTKDSLVLSSKLWFPKSVFTEAEYERIITRLTFIPKTSSMFDKDKNVEPIELFSEENGSIGLPRAFGYSLAMGMGYKSSDIIDLRTDNSGTIDFDFKFKLWDTQEKPVQDTIEALKANHNGAILSMPCGCHRKGQGILMYDGSTKLVEDIQIGDIVMGIDGGRKVINLHRGTQEMYKITPKKGNPLVVNKDHIQTFIWSGREASAKYSHGQFIDMTIGDYFKFSKSDRKDRLLLHRPGITKFNNEILDLKIDPYHLGLLLGDGSIIRSINITTMDSEISNECFKLAEQFNCRVRVRSQKNNKSKIYHIVPNSKINTLKLELTNLGLFGLNSGSKFIPRDYKTSSLNNRLKILAGLLDTDGSYTKKGFDYISKSEVLADDVVFICRSVGLAAYKNKCTKKCQTGFSGDYYRVYISGNCDIIPTKIKRKISEKRLINKDVRNVGIKSIELLDPEEYFGFEVDGDNRYLLSDFILTHNSGKTISSLYIASVLKAPTMVILHDDGLLTQWIDEAKKFLNLKDEDIGIVKQNTCNFKGKRVVFASTKSIHSRANKYPKELFMWPTLVIYDEVHRTGARTFSTWMNLMRSKYILGLSATPRRWDGCEDIFYHNIGEVSAIGEAKRLTPRIFLIRLPLMVPDITNSMGMPLTPIMISRMCGTKTPKGQVKAISAPNTVSIKRNTFIGNDAVEALKAGRRVLILSNRIPQLDELRKYIESRVKTTVGWYIGGMSGKAKKESKECNLVLATYKLGSEGMDIPGMDTLILASPISDVEQAVGRILRLKDGKKEPFVFDYVDPNKAFSGMFNARLKFYNKQNYRVTTIVKS